MGNGHNKKIECDDCNQKHSSRNVIYFKGKYRCRNCRNKLEGCLIGMNLLIPKTVEECLDKIYEIRPTSVVTNLSGTCYFNRILIGKKFKIKLIKDDDDIL